MVPNVDAWVSSAHAAIDTRPFRAWDEDDPAEVPTSCAKCHSTTGYRDYLGADGSEAGVTDAAVAVGEVISCVACHNDVTLTKTSVVMPSGVELTGLGDESRCMECHQGRESKVSVDKFIADAAAESDDTVSDKLRFRNIHYFPAAATKYGTLAKGGYEYDGKAYDGNFGHVDDYNSCIKCHNPHTLKVKVSECAACHEDVAEVEDLKDVRMAGSMKDYDGDGDVEEGIYYELQGVSELLYGAIQTYATTVLTTAIVYDASSYPYFFADVNGNDAKDDDEGAYFAWTPRLVKATYNYQTYQKDPGAFAHGGKYDIQLMYDSTMDLNAALADSAVDMSAMSRIDAGHFAGSETAFRRWDEEGAVPGSCARCHSGNGLAMYIAEGVNISQPIANGFQCANCHNDLVEFTRYEVESVKFPSGMTVDAREFIGEEDTNTNLCMTCHQGRESGLSVDRLTKGIEADATSDKLRFLNVHYFAAGATRFGADANGAYQYADKEYAGFFEHTDDAASCTDCHGAHSLQVETATCMECHEEMEDSEDIRDIRYTFGDWNGNGDDEEGIYYEVTAMQEALYQAMQDYALETVETGIAYNPAAYPYFFTDTNGNSVADPDESVRANGFAKWTPRLLQAAYNYQYVSKDPGAFAHNGAYVLQVLYDGLEDLGADVSGMERP
ncbi:MAG: hypothetical protein HY328_03495 [Chloroflexi bacterium]|nr:hypothetical protein [Chloroflexota bacterium]